MSNLEHPWRIGFKKGVELRTKEIAITMIKLGCKTRLIERVTNLSLLQIQNLEYKYK